jgi:redox-sensitive bicupin YhaK (pirin superfamily)
MQTESTTTIKAIEPLGFPWASRDPFLFCAHHRDEYPEGNDDLGPDTSHLRGRNIGQDFTLRDGWRMYHGLSVPGFPYHPHRGFETITIVKEGFVDHSDSMGAAGRFGAGDVQWMTAGKGVLHSEMFPLLNKDKGNPGELFQVWLNLPKANKMVEPHFRMLWAEDIPVLKVHDDNGRTTEVNVIAGTLDGVTPPAPPPKSWAADTGNHVMVLTIRMEPGAAWTLPATVRDVHRTLYFYRGNGLRVEGEAIPAYHSVALQPDTDVTLQAAEEACYLLLLQGKPMNEPVAQHGPFVMNTEQEIVEAFAEYRRTQFGGWPWPKEEMTHGRRGRFALHADGREEEFGG